MVSFQPAGTNITQRITFNTGYIDFGNSRIVDIVNSSLTLQWSTEELYVVGSIKPADLVRHSQRVSLTGTIKSFAPEMEAMAWGSSSVGTPSNIFTLDGQPTMQNPILTLFDRNGKEYQYQLYNAVFKSSKLSTKAEDFAQWDFELEAMDIAALVYTP